MSWSAGPDNEKEVPWRMTRKDTNVIHEPSLFTDQDVYLFREGSHFRLYEKLGAHPMTWEGDGGVLFAVWAPNADLVAVKGDFNGWSNETHPLHRREDGTGIWEGFVPGIGEGTLFKYHIISGGGRYRADKGDPFSFAWQVPPATASVVRDLSYDWTDNEWMKNRGPKNAPDSPFAVYEVHPGSWKRVPEEGGRYLTYRELAQQLPAYVSEMGFTHVEFMPVMEHPFYGSWGYQTTGYFAPTARYGNPQDFMYLIERLHRSGIGVILDWVPSHFPDDLHGLVYFDGTYLYEHSDPRKGYHPDWHSYIFNYGRNEVRSFLVSSAVFWLEKYHADGLRIDAVASMLYLDYGRKEGQWIPNAYGGRENLEAIDFLRKMNDEVYRALPDVQMIAEESTAWPMVSRPSHLGGLGFGMKWNMGWMHDTLSYFSEDPVFRKYHHNQLTFSLLYAFSENFMLALSHDEVVYGKGSLLSRMPGDDWQKSANLRLLLGYLYAHPGKKLLFMGGEFGQRREWSHEGSLDWHLLQYPLHEGIQTWVKHLNMLYKGEPALYKNDFTADGFEWVDCSDWEESIVCFLRKGSAKGETMLVVCNFTPVVRTNYRVGVPSGGYWKELLNSDAKEYGGSGQGNFGGVEASPVPFHGRYTSVLLTLPPLGILFFRESEAEK
jgi:1,4-alpha-glucan branching enzyme